MSNTNPQQPDMDAATRRCPDQRRVDHFRCTGWLGLRGSAYVLRAAGDCERTCGNRAAMLDIVQGVFASLEESGVTFDDCRDAVEVEARLLAYLVSGKRALEGR